MPLSLDPDVGAGLAAMTGGKALPRPTVGDVQTFRARTNGLIQLIQATAPPDPDGIVIKDFKTKSADGAEITLRWFAMSKRNTGSTGGPAILHIHGGGMMSGNIDLPAPMIKMFVSQTNVPFLSVEYRLAPEQPAPKPLEDCYAGLQYLFDHAKELEVDINRVGVMGESAGGGLAACLAHYCKEKGGPGIKKQILIYPMLDDRTTKTDPNIEPYAVWTYEGNITGWGALLGKAAGGDNVPVIHAAGRMTVEQAKGLPPAYIDVGTLDVFRDEDLEYALKLSKAGVDCEFHLLPGQTHAFEVLAPQSDATKLVTERRCKAIARL